MLGLFAAMAIGLVLGDRQVTAWTDSRALPPWDDSGAESLAADRDTADRIDKLLGRDEHSQPDGVYQGVLFTTFRTPWEEALAEGERIRRAGSDYAPSDWKKTETLYRAVLAPTRGPVDSDIEWLIWAELATLRRLRMISASGRAVEDRHVDVIAEHGGLRLLDLSGTRVSAAMVQKVARSLPRLRRLIIDRRMLSDSECRALRRSLPELELHVVGDDEIGAAAAADSLFGMPPPPWLCRELIESGGYRPQDFDGTIRVARHTGGGRGHKASNLNRPFLTGLTRGLDIVILEFDGSDADDETVRTISGRPAPIVYLSLADSKVTSAMAPSLRGLPELRVLHVDEQVVSAAMIEVLRTLKHLRWVTIDCPRLPSAVAAKLEAALPGATIRQRLEKRGGEFNGPPWALDLRGDEPRGFFAGDLAAFGFWTEAEARMPDTEVLDTLVRQPSPKRLRLYCALTDNSLKLDPATLDQRVLEQIGRLTHMDHLELEPDITATRYEPLENLRNLDYLTAHCRRLSADDVARLCGTLKKLPRFRELILFDVELSNGAVEQLRAIPTLRRLSIISLRRKVSLPEPIEELFAKLPQLTELSLNGGKKLQRAAR